MGRSGKREVGAEEAESAKLAQKQADVAQSVDGTKRMGYEFVQCMEGNFRVALGCGL